MKQPDAQTVIKLLAELKNQVSAAALAYWVTPNTILTLSGVRAYCDGVFYHNDKKVLESWVQEMKATIKVMKSVTDVYFAEAKVDKSSSKQRFAGYDVIFTQGLGFVFKNTELLGTAKAELMQQKLTGKQLIEAMCSLLKQDERFKHFNKENLNHIAFGILVGYPDKAILSSITEWEKDDPFAEPLIDADIRGSWYYICPRPVYSYARHMVTDPGINAHEQLWSTILKDFYTSEFHKNLEADTNFRQKLKQLGMLR